MITTALQAATAALKAKLDGITAAAGYNTAPQVRVARFEPEAMQDVQLVLRLLSFAPVAEGVPMGLTDVVQTYGIGVIVRQAGNTARPLHDLMLAAAADVERAVMADVTLGGAAVLTEFAGGSVLDLEDAGLYGIDLQFMVRVRYPQDQPYTPEE
jgi:hypothetical protein